MKKLILMIAAVAAISFTACTGEGTTTEGENAEATELTAENFETQLDSLINASDTAAIQNLLAQSQGQVEALIAKGDTVAAKTFVEKVQAIINTNKEKLVALTPSFNTTLDKAVGLPDAIKEIVTAGTDSLKNVTTEEIKNQVEDAKATAEKVKEGAEKVKEGAEKAKAAAEKAKETAEKAKEAANALKNLGK